MLLYKYEISSYKKSPLSPQLYDELLVPSDESFHSARNGVCLFYIVHYVYRECVWDFLF